MTTGGWTSLNTL